MATLPDSYPTLASPGDFEQKIQRSRFIAVAAPADDESAARAVVDTMRRRYHDARHVCFAWRLGIADATVEFRNDDGEPSGTAGEPILLAIRGAGLTDTVVAVARYFGGVKLGTGGLTRAYGSSAQAALQAAPRRTVLLGRRFNLDLDYAQQKTVRHLLEKHRGHVEHEDYTDRIAWRLWLPHSTWQSFADALCEATAAQLALRPAEDVSGTGEPTS